MSFPISYMAGLFDAEGCVGIARDTYRKTVQHRLQISIALTDRDLLDDIKAQYGGFICTVKRYDERHVGGYQWYLTNGNAAEMLRQMLPLLIVKRLQADVALEFSEGRERLPDNFSSDHPQMIWREALHERMRLLNLKGDNTASTKPTRGKIIHGHERNEYLAGMVDGDGSIFIGRSYKTRRDGTVYAKHELVLTVVNTSEVLIDWLFEMFGGSLTTSNYVPGWKVRRQWKVGNRRALDILKLIGPSLHLKGEQYRLALALRNDGIALTRGSLVTASRVEARRRDRLYGRMRLLNQRGNSAATTKPTAPTVLSGESIV